MSHTHTHTHTHTCKMAHTHTHTCKMAHPHKHTHTQSLILIHNDAIMHILYVNTHASTHVHPKALAIQMPLREHLTPCFISPHKRLLHSEQYVGFIAFQLLNLWESGSGKGVPDVHQNCPSAHNTCTCTCT